MPSSLDKCIAPTWKTIQAEWDSSLAFFCAAGLSRDRAHLLAMATHELLENAVKYGKFAPNQSIDLKLEATAQVITIEVRSPIHTDAQGLRALDDTIQWIRGFQNPFEAYVERLKQVAAQPYTPAVSGLGLVRIAFEAQCVLDFYVDDADHVALSAVFRLPQ